jgi:hypothetical protein
VSQVIIQSFSFVLDQQIGHYGIHDTATDLIHLQYANIITNQDGLILCNIVNLQKMRACSEPVRDVHHNDDDGTAIKILHEHANASFGTILSKTTRLSALRELIANSFHLAKNDADKFRLSFQNAKSEDVYIETTIDLVSVHLMAANHGIKVVMMKIRLPQHYDFHLKKIQKLGNGTHQQQNKLT